MLCVKSLLLLVTIYGITTSANLLGGKQPISDEDYKSESFDVLANEASHRCNTLGNQKHWYRPEAILGGTKQVVSGILYEFHLRHLKTECSRDEMLKRNQHELLSLCEAQPNATQAICSLKIWHKPWTNNSEITVRGIWLIDESDGLISETVRKLDEAHRGPDRTVIEEAITDFNIHDGKPNLYKFFGATETVRQHKGEPTKVFKVILAETKCPNEKDQMKNFQHKKEECYDTLSMDELECTLPMTKETLNRPQFSDCTSFRQGLRGMWRSASQGTGSSMCFIDPSIPPNVTNPQKVEVHAMKNFARTDIRILSIDEVHGKEFQEMLKRVIWKYNEQGDSPFVYQLKKVENARIEFEPRISRTFTLWAQELPCRKWQNQLLKQDNFLKECTEPHQSPYPRPIKKCEVTVTTMETDNGPMESIIFDDCKKMDGEIGAQLVGQNYIEPGTSAHETSLVIASQAVDQYNSERKALYEYKLESIQNAITQVTSGMLYKMSITMKPVSCKITRDLSCLDPNKENYLHCAVSALVKPRLLNREVNITSCWQQEVMKQPMDGTWSYLTPEELMQLREGDILQSVLRTYQTIYKYMANTSIDYLSDGSKVQDGEDEFVSFKLHLKSNSVDHTRYECNVIVVHQQDQPDKRRLSKCVEKAPPPTKPNLLGGPRKITTENQRTPEYRMKIKNAVHKFNAKSNDLFYHRLLSVKNPKTQVVAGVLTSFTLHLQQTSCRKNKHTLWHADKAPQLCGKLNNTHMTECVVKIWEKPWENFTKLELKDCQFMAIAKPVPVQSTSDDLQESDAFKELLPNVVVLFNLNSHVTMLYQAHLVDALSRTAEKPNEIQFNLTLSPTKCRKWDDVVSFKDGRVGHCTGVATPRNLAKCQVKVVEFDRGATIHLSNCEYIHFGEYSPRRSQHAWERASVTFQQAVEKAVNLFNARVDSAYWYKLFAIEDPTIEHISGLQYTFKLHMLPKTCRSEKTKNNTVQNVSHGDCKDMKPEFLVSCNARYWQRAWEGFHETIDVNGCEIIPIKRSAAVVNEQQANKKKLEANIQCLDSHEKRLLKLFTDQEKLVQPYEKDAWEKVEEMVAPGRHLTFEVYFKPESTAQDCSKDDKEKCPTEKSFYVCKGSYWWKDWKETETVKLSQCRKISTLPVTIVKPVSTMEDPEVKEMISKAVNLYNEKLTELYIFTDDEVKDFKRVTDIGIKTTFVLHMKPNACKRTLGRRSCKPHLSKTRVECSVTVWQRPWLGENEEFSLERCREYFVQPTGTEPQPITDEEKESDSFKEMVEKLGKLYKSRVPILYKLEQFEDAMVVQNASHRTITLSLIFEPTGCDTTKPKANDPACLAWKDQDKVRCEAEIVQNTGESSKRMLGLTECAPILEPIQKRELKLSEYESNRFNQALQKAWELFHRITKNSTQLYNLLHARRGTIERDIEEKITCTVTFQETVCKRGIDDQKFSSFYSLDCISTKPEVLQRCEMELITNKKGQKVSLNCEAPKKHVAETQTR